ncbi:hypothetical protein PAEPH01_2138 [Pancytospora epiphaga]|nr:hypothetical protein PAEPH01_2138 [Pancytospora epiphaga]
MIIGRMNPLFFKQYFRATSIQVHHHLYREEPKVHPSLVEALKQQRISDKLSKKNASGVGHDIVTENKHYDRSKTVDYVVKATTKLVVERISEKGYPFNRVQVDVELFNKMTTSMFEKLLEQKNKNNEEEQYEAEVDEDDCETEYDDYIPDDAYIKFVSARVDNSSVVPHEALKADGSEKKKPGEYEASKATC